MKHGFVFTRSDPRAIAEAAREAERAGWDGFFIADLVWGMDAWVSLAAAAVRTSCIRLGTMLTPLAWTRPWKLASETAALDHLSNGRVILSVGLGANDTGVANFGLPTERKLKAELVDEGLEILNGLWRGQPFSYEGQHYKIQPTAFQPPPPPVQKPRIPIWVVGAWPRMKSMRRALRCDGLLPARLDQEGELGTLTPDDVREMKAFVESNRALTGPFDIVVEGKTPGNAPRKAAAIIRDWAEAGATWWIESPWSKSEKAMTRRLEQGPPDD